MKPELTPEDKQRIEQEAFATFGSGILTYPAFIKGAEYATLYERKQQAFICDECKFIREPHEHRCLGNGCKCPRCESVRIFQWVVKNDYPHFMHMTKEQLVDIIFRYATSK